MKTGKIFIFLLLGGLNISSAQSAPPHLKYFGYAVVDCGVDDPNDAATLTNYISEVDSFSNIAELCVENYTDTVIARVNLMNNSCVLPILATSHIFYYLKDANGPSGANYDLYSDYKARWTAFKANNASVLTAAKIGMFYIVDEPTWNGVTYPELDTVCALMKSDFPNIPITFIEAYTEVDSLKVPTTIDWFGFDRYGIADVSTDSTYLSELSITKSKRSTAKQKILLVADDQFMPGYPGQGWQPDTIGYVFQNYYNLAASDTNIIGIAAVTWPGLAPGWLGTRSLPKKVINKNVQIGKMIKKNFSPCSNSGINEQTAKAEVKIYPIPVQDKLNILCPQNSGTIQIRICNTLGKLVGVQSINTDPSSVSVENLSPGIYFYQITSKDASILSSGKFVKE